MIINKELLDSLTEQAKNSSRLRQAFDLRTTPDDGSQRILNAVEPGTVLPIHRHRGSTETIAVLRGQVVQYLYDSDGKEIDKVRLSVGSDTVAMSVPVGQWHRLESLESGTVILECKDGMYEPLAEEDILSDTPVAKTPKTWTEIIPEAYRGRIAFVVGNGINRYSSNSNNKSWESMLVDIWNDLAKNQIKKIADTSISLTEFSDIINLSAVSNDDIRKRVVADTLKIKETDYHKRLRKRLIEIGRPVLTTNYDSLLERRLFYHHCSSPKYKGFSDVYPWSDYYARKNGRLEKPDDGFGVWHINGMLKYKRSIRLSLSEYCQQIARIKDILHNGRDTIGACPTNKSDEWKGDDTWLHMIFFCPLVIFGLGLDKDEVCLRWLLIERAKFYENFNKYRLPGWYLCKDGELDQTKRMFLESVGLTIVEMNSFKEIYEDFLGV